MAKLATGSIILFGSRLPEAKGGFCFLLDAVFVVGDHKEFAPAAIPKELKGFVPEDYFGIMHFENYKGINVPLTCYKGVTFEQSLDPTYPVNGMYSFVPCRSYDGDKGFERPCLYAKDFATIENELFLANPILTDKNNRAAKGTVITSEQAQILWDFVRRKIIEQGYVEGVNLQYETKL